MGKFGDFYCEKCGYMFDESYYLENKPQCPECGGTFFVRKPNLQIKGYGGGWCGKSDMWDASIRGLAEQAAGVNSDRKAKGDKQRLERGMGGMNVKRNIH